MHSTKTVWNKWEKLEHIGKAIFDVMLKVITKSWGHFRIYQLTSTVIPAIITFSMASYHKWDVKNGLAYVLQFFSLICYGLGGVPNFVTGKDEKLCVS